MHKMITRVYTHTFTSTHIHTHPYTRTHTASSASKGLSGSSSVGMGTAPAIWNDVVGLFVCLFVCLFVFGNDLCFECQHASPIKRGAINHSTRFRSSGNIQMGIMVDVVPRDLWRKKWFSMGLARFSKPLVTVTDLFVGETYAQPQP